MPCSARAIARRFLTFSYPSQLKPILLRAFLESNFVLLHHKLHVGRGIPYNSTRYAVGLTLNGAVRGRSEGFPRTGYFVPGCDGTGAWQISGIVRVTARACFVFLRFSLGTRAGAGDARGRWGRAQALGTRAGVIVS